MLTKPDEQVRKCLTKLRSDEFAPLLDFLKRENGVVLGSMMHIVDEKILRQYQGRAQFAHELLGLIVDTKVE